MAFKSSSSPRPPPTPRRPSSISVNTNPSHPNTTTHQVDLAQSLQNLSLTTSPATTRSPRSPQPRTPYRSSSTSLTSATTIAHSKASPRSPSMGRESRSATPTLFRKTSTSSLRSPSVGPRPGTSLSRRASANNLSGAMPKSPLSISEPAFEPKPVVTAESIAKDFFAADLQFHQDGKDHTRRPTDTTVIFHDSCYGHRFSRPGCSERDILYIVERPERLKACALGVAAAYVRLGDRHAGGRYSIHPNLNPGSIPDVPFRIHRVARRLSLLSPAVVAVHGKEWMEELKAMCDSTKSKLAAERSEVERSNENLKPGQEPKAQLNSGDLYLGPESLDAMEGAMGAVCEAVDTVFGPGPNKCFVAIRPPGHHCSDDYPSGFCWVNNVHVGIAHAMMNHGLTHAAIIDFDLHHGDGSQTIAWNHNHRHTYGKGRGGLSAWKKSSIGYYSLHDINSFPCEAGNPEKVMNASLCIENSHGQNIWNVHLQPWKTESEFWELYESRYSVLLQKAQSFLQLQSDKLRAAKKTPKAAIFFSAGFDASEWESPGMQRHSVMVPTDFYARIAHDIAKIAAEPQTAVGGRIISVLEGGYSDRAIASGVFSHLSGLATGASVDHKSRPSTATSTTEEEGRLGTEIAQRMAIAPEKPAVVDRNQTSTSERTYDSSWWAGDQLDSLERVVAAPPREPRKPRHTVPPTYSSPTHASTAKATDPVKLRRSLSGASGLNGGVAASRPPSPPPPEVPWTTAVNELYKLLVPEGRATESCTVKEIGELVAQAKLEYRLPLHTVSPKPAEASVLSPGAQRAGLRDRRSKAIEAIYEEEGEKPVRGRKKSGVNGIVLTHASNEVAQPVRRSARRASLASVSYVGQDELALTEGSDSGRSTQLPEAASAPSTVKVKKTRPPPAPRRETARPASRATTTSTTVPKRPAPAKKPAPKATTAATRPGQTVTTAKRGPMGIITPPDTTPDKQGMAGAAKPRAPRTGEASDDISLITSGMNKVRISLVDKTQQGERKKAGSSPSPTSTGASIPPGRIRLVRPGHQQDSVKSSPERPQAGDGAHTNQQFAPPSSTRPPDAAQDDKQLPAVSVSTPVTGPAPTAVSFDSPDPLAVPLPTSSPVDASPSCGSSGAPLTPDLFVPFQPEGPTPMALPIGEPVRFLPPNQGTPTPTPTPMKKVELPSFTATSAIPFAPRGPDGGEKSRSAVSVWDIPDTPRQ